MKSKTKAHFLLVEDDDDHAELVEFSMKNIDGSNSLERVCNGKEAIAYLMREAPFTEAKRPDVILLDLNMPMVNGHEVIKFAKSNPDFRTIPIVVLTTSNAEQDRNRAYQAHANSYVVKPLDFTLFQKLVSDLEEYWSQWNQSSSHDNSEHSQIGEIIHPSSDQHPPSKQAS